MEDNPPPIGGQELFNLRWNNHHENLVASLETLLVEERLVDVSFVCENRHVLAHRFMLGANSALFRELLSDHPCKHPIVIIIDTQAEVIEAILSFLYRGEATIAESHLSDIVRIAKFLKINSLVDTLEVAMEQKQNAEQAQRVSSPSVSPISPQTRRKQSRPRRRSGESDTPENLSMRRSPEPNGLKSVRLPKPRSPTKMEQDDSETEVPPPPPRMFPTHQEMFPNVPPPALNLTPPMFALDPALGLFTPGLEHKMYPLMDVEHRGGQQLDPSLYATAKKKWRPKGQHSAPRGGPPRSWTNAELTQALQHVWNKKMTTSQASRVFGIPYNSLLMYVRGKYGKSLKLEQLRKDCIGSPLDVLSMNSGNNNNNQPKHHDKDDHHNANQRSASSEPDIGSNPVFNPFPPGYYPEFPPGFPLHSLNMLHLLPPNEKARELYQSLPMALDSLSTKEEDCKSDRSKENSADEEGESYLGSHASHPQDNRTLLHHNGQD